MLPFLTPPRRRPGPLPLVLGAALLVAVIGALTVAGASRLDGGQQYLPILARPIPPALPQSITLTPFASGFSSVTNIVHAGDDRLFVTEKTGLIYVVDPAGVKTLFLDLTGEVYVPPEPEGFEMGLLGLVFHPDYATNGYFYVTYSDETGLEETPYKVVLARLQRDPLDPQLADPTSRVTLLEVLERTPHHKAGALHFGPDGYLYMAVGDGGHAIDPEPENLLAKLLRLDVDSAFPYAIPPDNPFLASDVVDEAWAIGLRNSWRFSFDRITGDLYIGEVGALSWEEINVQPASSPGGENYGWPCWEGNHSYQEIHCDPQAVYTFPVYEYEHGSACSVIGGYVYRGALTPSARGVYFLADFCSGDVHALLQTAGVWQVAQVGDFNITWSTFGEGVDGELYLGAYQHGAIYRLVINP